jgi:hypothetical protein
MMSGKFGIRTLHVSGLQAWLLPMGALALAIASASCASGPQPPQPGTPAFFWASAKESYHAGDFTRTDEQLQRILAGDNEFAARARPWDILISAGLAQGHAEMADAFEAGARMNRANPTPFRKQVTTERSYASSAAIQFSEEVHKFIARDKDPNVTFEFGYPAGALAQPAALGKIASGIPVQDSERELLQTAMLQRGVLQAVCKALDSDDNPAKAAGKLKKGEVLAPRNVFLWAAARMLEQQSQLYVPNKLDQPNRFILLSEQALEALKEIPETKDSKALEGKIRKALDKLKKAGA